MKLISVEITFNLIYLGIFRQYNDWWASSNLLSYLGNQGFFKSGNYCIIPGRLMNWIPKSGCLLFGFEFFPDNLEQAESFLWILKACKICIGNVGILIWWAIAGLLYSIYHRTSVVVSLNCIQVSIMTSALLLMGSDPCIVYRVGIF